MSKWISVKDELPEDRTSVLIYVPLHNEVHTAAFCDWEDDICDEWHISFGAHTYEPLTIKRKKVSHWMPLPEAPE